MKTLNVQVQPDRVPELDIAGCKALMTALAKLPGIADFSIDEGDDNGPFLNFFFETGQLHSLWQALQIIFQADDAIGASLRAGALVVCEGSRGWDDYLLLYHFDTSLERDTLS